MFSGFYETPVLDTTVPANDLVLQRKIKILERTSFPNQKVFPLVGFSLVFSPKIAPFSTRQ